MLGRVVILGQLQAAAVVVGSGCLCLMVQEQGVEVMFRKKMDVGWEGLEEGLSLS